MRHLLSIVCNSCKYKDTCTHTCTHIHSPPGSHIHIPGKECTKVSGNPIIREVRGKQITFNPRGNEKVMGLSQIGFLLTQDGDLVISSLAKRMQVVKDFQASALFHGIECVSDYESASILYIKNPPVSFVQDVYTVLEAFADPRLFSGTSKLLMDAKKRGKSDA